MRAFLGELLRPTRYNVVTAAVVISLLLVAYVVYPHQILQYGVWLLIFTVWMVWFVWAGVDYFYDVDA